MQYDHGRGAQARALAEPPKSPNSGGQFEALESVLWESPLSICYQPDTEQVGGGPALGEAAVGGATQNENIGNQRLASRG